MGVLLLLYSCTVIYLCTVSGVHGRQIETTDETGERSRNEKKFEDISENLNSFFNTWAGLGMQSPNHIYSASQIKPGANPHGANSGANPPRANPLGANPSGENSPEASDYEEPKSESNQKANFSAMTDYLTPIIMKTAQSFLHSGNLRKAADSASHFPGAENQDETDVVDEQSMSSVDADRSDESSDVRSEDASDDAFVEAADDQKFVETESGRYRDDTSKTASGQSRDPEAKSRIDEIEFLPGAFLPTRGGKETLHEIYARERMPEIQRIIASGDHDKIAKLIAENEEDPFTVLPNDLKYHELLAADLYFSFLTKLVSWFVLVALLLPVLVPLFSVLSLAAELAALFLLPDLP